MLWTVIQKPLSWTKGMLCITATGKHCDFTLSHGQMFCWMVLIAWIVFSGLPLTVNLVTTQRRQATVNEQLRLIPHTVKLMGEWGKLI